LPAPGAAQQRPAYGASVEVVRLHAAVLDGDGNPVVGLTADDFVVIDDGVEHPVALALSPGDTPVDVALVFDQSDSIRRGAPTVKQDVRAFLDALAPDDCAFVLPFQHGVGPGIWGPAADPSLLQTIDQMPLEGGTSLHDALIVGLSEVQGWSVPGVLAAQVTTAYRQPQIPGGVGIDVGSAGRVAPPPPIAAAPPPAARAGASQSPAAGASQSPRAGGLAAVLPGFDPADLPFRIFSPRLGCGQRAAEDGGATFAPRPDRRKALIVLTDGVDTTSSHTFGELLAFVHTADVPIFTVAIGHQGRRVTLDRDSQRAAAIARERLGALAAATGGRAIVASGSPDRLRAAYDEIVTVLRGSYLLGYYPRLDDGAAAGSDLHRHEVEVRVRRPGSKIAARSEYFRGANDSRTARLALRRGAEQLLAGWPDAALTEARTAVAADPGLWEAHFLAAAAEWVSSRPQAARVALARALELQPGVAAAHRLAWELDFELGDLPSAWQQAIRAVHAGAEMDREIVLLARRSPVPPNLQARLHAPRLFVEAGGGDDAAQQVRLAGVSLALAREVSASEAFGLVGQRLAADYFLHIDAEGPDDRRPRRLESRLALYNYANRRLWREDLDVSDLGDPQAVAAAVAETFAKLEGWLRDER
jgi:hypothetical protein